MNKESCPFCRELSLVITDDKLTCKNCQKYTRSLKFKEQVYNWAEQRQMWSWRLIIWIWFSWQLFLLINKSSSTWATIFNPLDWLNFGMHELGHFIFQPFGEFLKIAGGSIFQLLVPLLWLAGFLQKKMYFAASMCIAWLGMNFFDVAIYAADARARMLSLSSFAGLSGEQSDALYDRAHDWYQMLNRTNLLDYDLTIATWLRVAGTTCFVIGLGLSGLLMWHMYTGNRKHK